MTKDVVQVCTDNLGRKAEVYFFLDYNRTDLFLSPNEQYAFGPAYARYNLDKTEIYEFPVSGIGIFNTDINNLELKGFIVCEHDFYKNKAEVQKFFELLHAHIDTDPEKYGVRS